MELDKQITLEIQAELIAEGITAYPVRCVYCDENGRIGKKTCGTCNGTKEYSVVIEWIASGKGEKYEQHEKH